jgi:hypothetical protein
MTLGAVLATLACKAQADAITEWNQRSAQIIAEARIGTPPAVRVMALVQTAAYEAALDAARASAASPQAVDTAVAAAHRAASASCCRRSARLIDAAYHAALAHLPVDAARARQVAIGERAAQRVLAERAATCRAHRHLSSAHHARCLRADGDSRGHAVAAAQALAAAEAPTSSAPLPPPALTSDLWARDFNEIKSLGGRDSRAAQRRADRDRPLLGLLAAGRLLRRRSLGGHCSPDVTC